MKKNQKILLLDSSPTPSLAREEKIRSSLFFKRGTESELEIELCRTHKHELLNGVYNENL